MPFPNGLRAREYAKFRGTKHNETAMAMVNEDEAIPITLRVTTSGNTDLIPSPGADDALTIKGFHFSNNNSSKVTVSLRAGSGAPLKFSTVLAANGGNLDKNLNGRYWRLPLGAELFVNLSGTSDVYVTVEYESSAQPGEEALYLDDSISMTETLAKDVTTPAVADSQSIAEANAKDVATPLVDSIDISEGLVATGDRSKALSDSVAIAETLGNSTTLALNDAQTIVASIAVTYTPG